MVIQGERFAACVCSNMVLFSDMALKDQDQKLSEFTSALYQFLRERIDTIDLATMKGADFSTLLDLKRSVDDVIDRGFERWHSGKMN